MKREGSGGERGGEWIVHLCTREAWRQAQERGEYRAASLESDGFIHCSKPEQVLGVANRYYADVRDLVQLWIDPGKIAAEVRWEVVEGGEEYPHIYGGIDIEAIQAVTEFLPGANDVFKNFPHR